MQRLTARIVRSWGAWLIAPIFILILSGLLLAVGYHRHPREPNGLIQLAFFLVSFLAAGLTSLLALTCRLPGRGPRYLGRALYGVSLALQFALLLFDMTTIH